MEIVNSWNELYGAIRIPILKGIGRNQIKEFMSAYKAYVRRQDVRRHLGERVETLSMRSLVDLDKNGSEELEDEDINQYLKGCLMPSETHSPSLKELFGAIRIPVLKGIGRNQIKEFMSALKAYVRRQDVRRHLGERKG